MMQILIAIVVVWITANVLILTLIRATVRRSEQLEFNRDRLSKHWKKSKEI